MNFVEEFFKKHLEVMFCHFETEMIHAIFSKIVQPQVQDDDFGVRSHALNSIDKFNEFVFDNLRKPSKKRPELAQKV